jgi:hypothetical protein
MVEHSEIFPTLRRHIEKLETPLGSRPLVAVVQAPESRMRNDMTGSHGSNPCPSPKCERTVGIVADWWIERGGFDLNCVFEFV